MGVIVWIWRRKVFEAKSWLNYSVSAPEPSSTVLGFRLLEVTSNSVGFSWSPPQCSDRNGEFRGFRYELRNLDNGSHLVTSEMINDTSLRLYSLAPYTLFSIQVWFVNHMYEGPRHIPFKFRTLEDSKHMMTLPIVICVPDLTLARTHNLLDMVTQLATIR